MGAVRVANELADEPHEIALIVKDCADGTPDEDITQQWIDRVKKSVRSAQELLKTVNAGIKY
ncbi:MAG: hypothetical protein VB076_06520 [Synergistaceae bacterium]|nr:hypothetical protein [Synergistaceae bacterium]